jgi:malate synthase
VAAVDAADKTSVYRNWLGLMRGTLTCEFSKEGKTFTRKLTEDRTYTAHDGQPLTLKGRALMLVRNVGHLMKTPIVLYNGQEVPEGIVDAYITALIGLHDIENGNVNSQTGSVYIVKPKMHGPSEAAFAVDLFSACEQIIGLPQNTLKIGVMDEERRTSLNLAAVLYEVKQRVVFTNTGFLDRTGDEIHTAMRLGPVMRKQDMKSATWLQAYENNNVDVSLKSGFSGRGQIGKGMWTMPDLMRDMLDAKIAHPMSGANTAWVPSPTAATLHALHYHRVSVVKRQTQLRGRETDMRDLLTPPITEQPNWSTEEINAELENNLQGILGYIVRWIELGVGCSKVPDIDEVALMEDRATCRISSQILSNWLHWSIVDEAMLRSVAERMAAKVDQQNSKTKGYHPIAGHAAGHPVVDAAIALIKQGIDGPSGYTEPILHAARLAHKKADGE